MCYLTKKQLGPYIGEGCFVATAVYGDSYKLGVLREFRDEFLNPTKLGNILVRVYYRLSPPIANYIKKKEVLKLVIRGFLVEPSYYISKVLILIKKTL